MNSLFKERRQKHFLMLLKYWRLVFNDHFVIALFFLFGALAYGYAQWLPSIPAHNVWIELLLVIFMTVIAQLGRLATLVKTADPIFLLPETSRMKTYFRQSYGYSLFLGALISLVGLVVALPLASVTSRTSSWTIALLVIVTLFVKSGWLNLSYLQLSMSQSQNPYWRWLKWIGPVLVWGITWLLSPVAGLCLSLLWLIITSWLVRSNSAINWRVAVTAERDRMATVYRFFNLFTDVPNLQGRVKRRSYLNFIVNWLGQQSVWRFLYGRGLIRNTEISDLVFRLTLVMAAILIFIPITWLNSIIMALALYLIAAQLIPLYDQFANNAFSYVYPTTKDEQYYDFQIVFRKVMVIVAIWLAICSIGIHLRIVQVLINVIIAVIEVPLLTTNYLKYRIAKIEK